MIHNKWVVLAGLIILCLVTGFIGSLASMDAIPTWYATINKPSWNPPNWVFGPVWTILYIMMAVAAWRVWLTHDRVKPALTLFFIQLAFNLAWSLIFFGLRSPGGALIEVVPFWAAILATMLAFFGRDKWAGLLFVPYLAWVSFAAVLNFAIWRLN